jgi:hypothetical protein
MNKIEEKVSRNTLTPIAASFSDKGKGEGNSTKPLTSFFFCRIVKAA